MSTAFQIAVIFLAVAVGILATLGFFVVIKVFLAAFKLNAHIKGMPQQIAAQQQAIARAQAEVIAAQQSIALEKAALIEKAKGLVVPVVTVVEQAVGELPKKL